MTTFAGTAGTTGKTDATGAAARFTFPSDVAVDSSGNVFVADTDNQLIRLITSAGVVTTIAGSDGVGSTDGVGTAARFYNPKGIALDSSGNLYIADRRNHTIRKATPTTATAVAISTQPTTQSVVNGAGVTLSVVASGSPAPTTYQWYKDGVAITGATSSSYTIATASSTSAGSYTVVVGNGVTSITSSAAVLTVTVASRLSNLAVRTTLSANQVLTVGFTMSEGAKSLLVRAAGPGLGALGVPGTMADPKLTLFNGSTQIGTNDNWAGNPTVSAAIASVGAFPFPSTASLDAALVASVDGGRTVQVSGPAAGNLIVEAYDAGTGNSPRLTNLSALNRVGTGSDVLIAGFTLAGTGTKNVLIRAIGPSLTTLGVGGVLADPKLELYNSSQVKIGENDTYAASLSTTFSSVGAFPLTAGSKDAAVIVSLPAGGYTVQVSGADGGTGIAIIELYEVP